MDGFRVVKLDEVVRIVDVVITATGKCVWILINGIIICFIHFLEKKQRNLLKNE